MKKIKIALLLCWLGIHRYKVTGSTFVFGPRGTVESVQCKIYGIKKIRNKIKPHLNRTTKRAAIRAAFTLWWSEC